MNAVSPHLRSLVLEILETGRDLTLATVRPDGFPQATVVSYASDGLDILFGCGEQSQKARNLAADDRVSLTITLPYKDWGQIRGVSLSGRATRVTGDEALWQAGELFMRKFPEVSQYALTDGQVVFFRVRPEIVSVLDYARGFGHTDLVRADELA